MTQYEEVFALFLRKRGLRLTGQRKGILARVLSSQGHLRAESLVRDITAAGAASRASVYRTLDLMKEAGLLRKSNLGERHPRYERAFGHPDHDHMVCVKCGHVIEFRDPAVEEKLAEIAGKARFAARERRLQILGLCARCRETDTATSDGIPVQQSL